MMDMNRTLVSWDVVETWHEVHVECECGYYFDLEYQDLVDVQVDGHIVCECGDTIDVRHHLEYELSI